MFRDTEAVDQVDHRVWWDVHTLYKRWDHRKHKVIEGMCNFNSREGTYKLGPVMRALVERSVTPIPRDPPSLHPHHVGRVPT